MLGDRDAERLLTRLADGISEELVHAVAHGDAAPLAVRDPLVHALAVKESEGVVDTDEVTHTDTVGDTDCEADADDELDT